MPEGAVPKDGPSAGITMATAITSALIKIPVKREVAMTGEITLRGRVLPIGGLKEKLLAAKIGNIKTVMIPKGNVPDLKKISKEIIEGLEDHPGRACRPGPAARARGAEPRYLHEAQGRRRRGKGPAGRAREEEERRTGGTPTVAH